MPLSRHFKPIGLPVSYELGNRRPGTQDNIVYDLLTPHEKPHLRVPIGRVIKINHDPDKSDKSKSRQIMARHEDPREAVWRGIEYKKNKYDLVRHFLGDHIPKTAFIMTRANEGNRTRYMEMTLQQQVPENRLCDLSDEQRHDPRLKENLADLLARMQRMNSVLGEVNANSDNDLQLDAQLDLGGLSVTVRSERLDHVFTEQQVDDILDNNKSPNLLVDPETMNLYCIDFGQGQWIPGMDEVKQMAFSIDRQRTADDVRSHLGSFAAQ